MLDNPNRKSGPDSARPGARHWHPTGAGTRHCKDNHQRVPWGPRYEHVTRLHGLDRELDRSAHTARQARSQASQSREFAAR